MKKVDALYVLMWFGGVILIAAAIFTVGVILDQFVVMVIGMAFITVLVIVPGMLQTRMAKSALKLEEDFSLKGFSYQHKFTSNNAVYYIDINGRLGVVWRYNPKEFFFVDLSQVTDIRTHDGKQLLGTALVSCQFRLEGKKQKIYTLRVSNGQLAMTDKRVVNAIAKANDLCASLSLAQKNAASGGVASSF